MLHVRLAYRHLNPDKCGQSGMTPRRQDHFWPRIQIRIWRTNRLLRNYTLTSAPSPLGHDLKTMASLKQPGMLPDDFLEEDEYGNSKFFKRLASRIEATGVELPTVSVQYKELSAEVKVAVESAALTTLLNLVKNRGKVKTRPSCECRLTSH